MILNKYSIVAVFVYVLSGGISCAFEMVNLAQFRFVNTIIVTLKICCFKQVMHYFAFFQ